MSKSGWTALALAIGFVSLIASAVSHLFPGPPHLRPAAPITTTPLPPPTPPTPHQDTAADRAVVLSRAVQGLAEFKAELRKVRDGSRLISAVSLDDSNPQRLHITVTAAWLLQPKAVRTELTRALWMLWAKIDSPEKLDLARISLRTPTGTEVGGSRVWGGSLIWVDDN
jgi:hypothetical protein